MTEQRVFSTQLAEFCIEAMRRAGMTEAFTAGLIYGMLHRWPAQRTVEFATAAGCLKHSIPGDFNLVSFEEIQALAGGSGSGRIQR